MGRENIFVASSLGQRELNLSMCKMSLEPSIAFSNFFSRMLLKAVSFTNNNKVTLWGKCVLNNALCAVDNNWTNSVICMEMNEMFAVFAAGH